MTPRPGAPATIPEAAKSEPIDPEISQKKSGGPRVNLVRQSLFVTGDTDPGLSGMVVRDLGAIPEPATALLSLAGLLGLGLRRRR